MMRFAAPFASLVALAGLFLSCGNPVSIDKREDTFKAITLSVRDTVIDSMSVNGRNIYNKKAYLVAIQENEAWNPATDAPVFYNLYKVSAEDTTRKTFVMKLFGGGKGYSNGDRVCFRNPTAEIDTLVYRSPVETVVVIGTDDKSPFRFGCAAVTGAQYLGGMLFTGGFENDVIINSRRLLGGVSRYFAINDGKPYTISNRVIVSATLDTAGARILYLYRYSGIQYLDFPGVASIDSLLKAATPLDTQYVRINAKYRIKLADSSVYDGYGTLAGKYGGKDTIRLNALSSYFDNVSYGGESSWVAVQKTVTLPLGYGQKWVFLYSPTWTSAMNDDIDIQPFQGEIALDLNEGGIMLNAVEGKVCLLTDQVPFVFRTFGDKTFDPEISVWLATRNCNDRFMQYNQQQDLWQLTDLSITPMKDGAGFKIPWPDAVLETPPKDFSLPVSGELRNALQPDYENDYRVSPLCFLYMRMSDNKYLTQFDGYLFNRPNDPFLLSQLVKKGSFLGYSEKSLDNFKAYDSTSFVEGRLLKKPAAGWFRYVPLYPASSLDSVLSTAALKSYFGITDNDLVPDDKNGNRYFSVYSAFVHVPDQRYYYHHNFQDYIDLVSTVYGGPKLYRNPFRSIPYFLSYNMTGSKEFVLMAYARGKYFKEPRVFISVFSSPYTYVWDKTPPHIAWDPSISSMSSTYAPMYYVNPRNPSEKTSTDLSKTVIPYLFDVCLSGNSLFSSRQCSVRDVGFGKITSVRLCFNYASDFLSMEPVTGRRHYSKTTIVAAELSAQDLSGQIDASYQEGKASSGLGDVAFKGIDARLWQKGVWDMWLETSDDFGNSGVAPVMSQNSNYSDKLGLASVRQIEIK